MYKIFVIEDDKIISSNIKKELNKWNYNVLIADDWGNIIEEINDFNANLIIMDINLPQFDGFYWTKKIREKSNIPIIFISAFDTEPNAIRAISDGADDYINKPFSLSLLNAKVGALLRRTNGDYKNETNNVLKFKDYRFNTLTNEISNEKEASKLTPTEGYILKILIINKNNTIDKNKLIKLLWNNGDFINKNILNVNMSRLRTKLNKIGLHNVIITERSRGYKLIEVKE